MFFRKFMLLCAALGFIGFGSQESFADLPTGNQRVHFHCFVKPPAKRAKKCVVTGKVCVDFGVNSSSVRPAVCEGDPQPGDDTFHFSCPAPDNVVVNSGAEGSLSTTESDVDLIVTSTAENGPVLHVNAFENFTGDPEEYRAHLAYGDRDFYGECRVWLAPFPPTQD